MRGILSLLAKANLVELTEEERQDLPGEPIEETPVPEAPAIPEPAPTVISGNLGIQVDRPLETVYSAAGVPSSPFPAEKLLRVLDGLRSMDAPVRKAAVMAMDAADDNWQIQDCVTDAKAKLAAIDAYKKHLADQLTAEEGKTQQRMEEIQAKVQGSTEAVRQQIAELEQLLSRELQRSEQEKAQMAAALGQSKDAVAFENKRMDAESERLREITQFFDHALTAK